MMTLLCTDLDVNKNMLRCTLFLRLISIADNYLAMTAFILTGLHREIRSGLGRPTEFLTASVRNDVRVRLQMVSEGEENLTNGGRHFTLCRDRVL